MEVDQLRLMAGHFPDETAFRVVDGGALTFARWEEASNRLARGLTEQGLRKGDRVSILLDSTGALDWVVAYAAIHKAGCVAVPTNTRLARPELTSVLGHAEARAILTGGDLVDLAHELGALVPSVELVAGAPWDDLASRDGHEFQVPVEPDDLADILYTSGTTGLPKGVAVRHRSMSVLPNALPAWTGQSWMYGNPLFTFAGIGPLYLAMKSGMTILYFPRFDAGAWLRTVERERPLVVFIVPAMAQLLVAHPDFAHADLSGVAVCFVGSAPLPLPTWQRLQERMPNATVTNAYGMTEAGGICSISRDEAERHPGSVGRPTPPVIVRIAGDDGRDVPVDEVGEILVRVEGHEREY